MSTIQEKPVYKVQKDDDQAIDVKSLIYTCLNKWYLFVICVIIAVGAGWLYNHFSTPLFQVSGTVLIREDHSLDPTTIISGSRYGSYQNLSNEIAIIKSYSLCEDVVKKLNLEVTYFDDSHFKTTEMYQSTPFLVEFDSVIPQAIGLTYHIMIDNNSFTLKAKADHHSEYDYCSAQVIASSQEEINFEGKYAFDEWIDNGYNRFRIVKKDSFKPARDNGRKMSFVFSDYLTLTNRMRNFSINTLSKTSSIASIAMTGKNKAKMVDFVNTLMEVYVNRGLERKNIVLDNTVQFIDDQLEDTEESLSDAEISLQNFRVNHELTDLGTQSQQVINSIKKLEEQHATLSVDLKYYKRLQAYIQANIDDPSNLVAPSAMGINDPLVNRLVLDLVNLGQTKSSQLLTMTEEHPSVQKTEEQIMTAKRTLLEDLNNIISNTEMNIGEVESQLRKAEKQAKGLPEIERLLVGYERKFKYNQTTYNYLMQRRAEAQILKASNTADNEIIDYASTQRAIRVAPRNAVNLLIALIIGLLVPAIYLFLKNYFNTKIQSRKDIEKVTDFPIIGQISHHNGTSPLVVIERPKSPIAESFRSIRTNIDFLTQGKEKSTILVTGDMQSVGKTFNSINISSIYALYGKKTLLLGFDMRKPKLFQEFGLSNTIGLSSYLCNRNTLDEIIQNTRQLDSLDVITSGPIPPNPAELIASDKCNQLFEELKERYDYIIIDTPPLGLVTDAYLLMKYSDANIYIVRQGVTEKSIFESIIKDIEDRGLRVNIVVNGIQQDGSYGYGNYHYGYGYGYGNYRSYGYGEDSEGYYSYYGEDEEEGKKHKKKFLSKKE